MMRAWRFVCWIDEWGPVARGCMCDYRAREREEACLEDEWGGLGFGMGEKEQNDT